MTLDDSRSGKAYKYKVQSFATLWTHSRLYIFLVNGWLSGALCYYIFKQNDWHMIWYHRKCMDYTCITLSQICRWMYFISFLWCLLKQCTHLDGAWLSEKRMTRCIENLLLIIRHRGQWRGALMFSLIWMNGWVNNREANDLKCHCAHYDVTVMDADTVQGEARYNFPNYFSLTVSLGVCNTFKWVVTQNRNIKQRWLSAKLQ